MDKRHFIFLILIGCFFVTLIIFLGSYNVTGQSFVIKENDLLKSTIIPIVEAELIDRNGIFQGSIFQEVYARDNLWSVPVNDSEMVRVKFEKPISALNDITVFSKVVSGAPYIDIYDSKGNLVAGYIQVINHNYVKTYLTSLSGLEDTFDLYVVGGRVSFDYIVDPIISLVPTNLTQNTSRGQLTENTFTISNSQQASLSCYTNISSLANALNCTQAGTTALDAYFMFNVSLPLYSILHNISIYLQGANVRGADRLNLTLWNYTSAAFKNINGTNALPAGNSTQNLRLFMNQTSNPLTNYVSDQRMRILFHQQGLNLDTLKVDVMNVTVTYNNFNNQLIVQTLQFKGNNLDEVIASRELKQGLSLTSSTQRASLRVTLLSQTFNFVSGFAKFGGSSKIASQALSVTSPLSRFSGFFKEQQNTIGFNLLTGRAGAFDRRQSQTVNFNAIVSRVAGLFRAPFALLNLDEIVLRKGGFLRVQNQVITLNVVGERMSSLMTYIINTIQQLFIQPISSKFTGLFKSPSDSAVISSANSRIFGANRLTTNTLSFSSTVSRLAGLFRLPFQLFSFNLLTGRTAGLSRSEEQTLSLNSANSKIFGANRVSVNTISISAVTSRFYGFFKLPLQLLNFNSNAGKQFNNVRSQTQTLSLSNTVSRFTGLFKSPFQLFNIFSSQTDTAGFGRNSNQQISLNLVAYRFTGLFRLPFQFLSFNSNAEKQFGNVRSQTQTLSFQSTTSRLSNLFRAPVQLVNFYVVGQRASAFFTYLVQIVQQFLIQPIVSRFGDLFKSPSDVAKVVPTTSRLVGASRTSVNAFTLSSVTSRFYGFFKSPLQFLTFDLNTGRQFGGLRSQTQSLSLSNTASRFSGLFKFPLQLLNFNSITGRTTGLFRAEEQKLSLNSANSRFFGANRLTVNTITVSAITSRFYGFFKIPLQLLNILPSETENAGFGRRSSQQVNFNSVTSRFSGLFKSPLQLLLFNANAQRQFGTSRVSVNTLSLSNTVSRFTGLFKSPLQIFSFNTFSGRNTGLSRTSTDTFSFTTLTGRFTGLFRLPSQQISIGSNSYYTFGVIRMTTQPLSFVTFTGRMAGLTRLPVQMISFEILATRAGGLAQYLVSLTDRLNATTINNRLFYAFKSFSTAFQFLMNLLSEMASGTSGGTGSTGGSSGGGSGGGSSIVAARALPDISITPSKETVSIRQGEVVVKKFVIINRGSTVRKIELSALEINNFLKFETNSFDLAPGQSRTVKVTFFVEEITPPNIYLGKILVTSNGLTNEVLVAIDVSSKKPLFDIKLTILDKFLSVLPGDDILAELKLFNLGEIGRVDVIVSYSIIDSSGAVILKEQETSAIETQVATIKKMTLPSNIPPGDYIFSAIATYNDGIQDNSVTSSSWFKVIKRPSLSRILLVGFGIVLIMGIFIYIARKYFVDHRVKGHRHKYTSGGHFRKSVKHIVHRFADLKRHVHRR